MSDVIVTGTTRGRGGSGLVGVYRGWQGAVAGVGEGFQGCFRSGIQKSAGFNFRSGGMFSDQVSRSNIQEEKLDQTNIQ